MVPSTASGRATADFLATRDQIAEIVPDQPLGGRAFGLFDLLGR